MNRDTRIILAFLLSLCFLLMLFVGTARGEEFSPPLKFFTETSPPGFRKAVIGGRPDTMHWGADLYPLGDDLQVYAMADGIVVCHYPAPGWRKGVYYRGHYEFGALIIIQHADGTQTLYGHMAKTNVREGQRVTRGQPIAIVGSTGVSTGLHLHSAILENYMSRLKADEAILNRREFERKLLCK